MCSRLLAVIRSLIIAAACCQIATAMAMALSRPLLSSTKRHYRGNSLKLHENQHNQRELGMQMMLQQRASRNCDRHRRDILTAITISIIGGAPALASAAESESFDAPMNGLTRQIRTSVVKSAQVIDKLDSKWERFSDDFGLGVSRNQPKRNVIDAGGNGRSKKVVQSKPNNGIVPLDCVFSDNLLKQCDEVSF